MRHLKVVKFNAVPQSTLTIRDVRKQLINAQMLYLETGSMFYSDECSRLCKILEELGAVNINKKKEK